MRTLLFRQSGSKPGCVTETMGVFWMSWSFGFSQRPPAIMAGWNNAKWSHTTLQCREGCTLSWTLKNHRTPVKRLWPVVVCSLQIPSFSCLHTFGDKGFFSNWINTYLTIFQCNKQIMWILCICTWPDLRRTREIPRLLTFPTLSHHQNSKYQKLSKAFKHWILAGLAPLWSR